MSSATPHGTIEAMGPRVLIVDDHEGFRRMAHILLVREGYDVVGEAHDGASAISAARALRPDIILLDIQLPDIDGFEVVRALRADRMEKNVIFISSRDEADYGRRVAASRVRGFVPKAELSGSTIRSILDVNERSGEDVPDA